MDIKGELIKTNKPEEQKEELINPFVFDPPTEPEPVQTTEKVVEVEAVVQPDNQEPIINPFVTDKKHPDQKDYLLLLTRVYEGEEDTSQSWHIIPGRFRAREFLIEKIKEGTIDVYKSYVAVEGVTLKLMSFEGGKVTLPTVYEIFTDPRSSWTREELFKDNFNIDDYVGDDDPEVEETPLNQNNYQEAVPFDYSGPAYSAEHTRSMLHSDGQDV